MYKVLLVDDEMPAVNMMSILLGQYPEFEIVGSFTNYKDAIDKIEALNPDIAFLDIEMNNMDGISLAKRLRIIKPELFIVFSTAFENYAVDAFEVNAMDYIVKPVRKDRLITTLDRFKEVFKHKGENNSYIKLMGKFVVSVNDEILHFRTSKVKELLAYLVHNIDYPVSTQSIIENLWPDSEAEKSRNLFYTTMNQLKKSLKKFDNFEILKVNKMYGISINRIKLDLKEFMSLLEKDVPTYEEMINMLNLYENGYLFENDYIWAKEFDNYIKSKLFVKLEKYIDKMIFDKLYQRSRTLLELYIYIDPFNEKTHERLLYCAFMDNRDDKVSEYYKKYSEIMIEELGIEALEVDDLINQCIRVYG